MGLKNSSCPSTFFGIARTHLLSVIRQLQNFIELEGNLAVLNIESGFTGGH